MVNLKGNPFFLNDDQVKWVEDTLAGMDLNAKVGQLFCPVGVSADEGLLYHLTKDIKIGGIMYRPGMAEDVQETHRKLQELSDIPLLIAANTEGGGDGLAYEGTSFGKPMNVAATKNPEDAYHMGYVACKEGAALGLNWSFAPIVDINAEFHSPITNVRTFGDNPDYVLTCGLEYMKGADENDVAVAIKHFPGDGYDERDQHIVTSINPLSVEEWDASFGKIYGGLIDKGAKTVMVGHIAQPAYVKALNPNATPEEQLYPATLSKEILTGLLRGKLGFNGLISTDATPMIGFNVAMPRSKAVPTAIAAGADVILFNKSLEEDYQFVLQGIDDGILTVERLDEAVTRILATKASLHLPEKKAAGTLVPGKEAISIVGCEQHREWAKSVADRSVTLVKDTQSLLPISTQKFKRVYLNVIQKDLDPNNAQVTAWKELFEKEGFEVTVRNRSTTFAPEDFASLPNLEPDKMKLFGELYRSVEDMKKDYDLYVYIANMENQSNNTTVRLNWNVVFGLGDDAPWFVQEVPTLMISTAYPYHLFDANMIKTYINAYASTPEVKEAVMDKIMGRSEFKGVSPVDPFCGNELFKY